MNINRLNQSYILKNHTFEKVKEWVNSLKYFYFVRALGGLVNDGDCFEARINYLDKNDLIHKMNELNIELKEIPENYPRQELNKSYTSAELKQFKSEIKNYPELEQPGHTVIDGIKVFIWITDVINFSISGTNTNNHYEVTNNDFEQCKKLEKVFDKNNWSEFKNMEIEKNKNCISKQKYSYFFEDNHNKLDLEYKRIANEHFQQKNNYFQKTLFLKSLIFIPFGVFILIFGIKGILSENDYFVNPYLLTFLGLFMIAISLLNIKKNYINKK